MEDFRKNDRIENEETESFDSGLNLLTFGDSMRVSQNFSTNSDLQALGLTTISNDSHSDAVNASDERSLMAPASAPVERRYDPLLGLNGPLRSEPALAAPNELEEIANRWMLAIPNADLSTRNALNNRLPQDLPVVINGLFSGERNATQIISLMLGNGVSAETINRAVVERFDREMRNASPQSPFAPNRELVDFMARVSLQNNREGNQALNSLINTARGSNESAWNASRALVDSAAIGSDYAARVSQLTRQESTAFLDGARNSLRNNEPISMNSLQFAYISLGLQQQNPAAVEVAARLSAGQGGVSLEIQRYFGRELLLSAGSVRGQNQVQAAEQVMSMLVQVGPGQNSLELTRQLAERYPQALTNVVNSLRLQSQSENAQTRSSAFSELAFVAAGGFGQNAQSQSARNILTSVAQTPEGRQLVNSALDSNRNHGLNDEITRLRQSIDRIATRPTDEQQIRLNQTQLMRDLFPHLNPQELNDLREQGIRRHGEDAFQRFLANARMYQSASPEVRNIMLSNQPIPTNPAANDNLLAPPVTPAPSLDLTQALRQFAQGELQGANQTLNNVHTRVNALVSAIQHQIGANERAISEAQVRLQARVDGLAGSLRPNTEAPTLGPTQARLSPTELLQQTRDSQQEISRLNSSARGAQDRLNRVLGIQLVGAHSMLAQQNPAAADSFAIMANNYSPSHLPSSLRNEVHNNDGSPGPALDRAASRNLAVALNPTNPTNAREIIRRAGALPDIERDSLTNERLAGVDILQGIASGRLQADAAQLHAEARAAQLYGAARSVTNNSDNLMHITSRLGDFGALQQFADIAGNVANSGSDIRAFIANEFQNLENLVAPRPHVGPRNIDHTPATGPVDNTPNPQEEQERQREAVRRELSAVNEALQMLNPAHLDTEAGRELLARQRGLRALNNLMDPRSELNAGLRNLAEQFRNQNVSMSEQFLRQAAPILVELSFAAAVSALPGFGQVAALGRVGRIAQFLLSNPIVRETVRSEALGAVHSILGTGEAGQVSSLLAGRTSFESAARDYALNGLYGRLSGGVVQNVSTAAQRRFRYGASIVDGVNAQLQNGFVSAVNSGIDRAISNHRP